MFFVSEIKTTAPEQFRTPLQENVYRTLDNLHIPFERVDTDEAITMDDCFQIDAKLQVKIVKTLFLCNRQHTAYYLFITLGSKPFSSKNFSASLGISRVSFALLDGENQVQIVFDRAVLDEKYYGCSDGTTTGYMKVSTEDILRKFLPSAHHVALIAEV
jgi:Ala-tRNA(Pro) deacylase